MFFVSENIIHLKIINRYGPKTQPGCTLYLTASQEELTFVNYFLVSR